MNPNVVSAVDGPPFRPRRMLTATAIAALVATACVDEPMSPMLDDTTLDAQSSPGRVLYRMGQDELDRLERESELGYPSHGVPDLGQRPGDRDDEMPGLTPDISVPDSITRRPRELARTRSAPSAVTMSLDIPEVCHRDSPALDFDRGWVFFGDDCNALLAAKDQLRGTVGLNWDTATVMTEWDGVVLGNLGVERLYLHFLGLDGSVPPGLGALDDLEVLSLGRNELTGEIPPELGSMRSLERLYLQQNQLTGEIPPEIGALRRLERLYLWGNQLSGEISPELGSLTWLERLDFGINNLTGEIPTELGSLRSLADLILWSNELTGPIPAELGQLRNLKRLSLAKNELIGEIPSELTDLRDLTRLELDRNQLTGPIPTPDSDDAWKYLTTLTLYDNELSGAVPAELGSLDLRDLAISGNAELTGSLPLELRHLTLYSFYWQGTGLCSPSEPSFQAWLASIESWNDGRYYGGGPVCDADGGDGGGTRTYQTGETISTLPTGFWTPDAVSGATFQLSSGQVTISFDSGGYIEEAGVRYTCRASGGCRIVNRVVTQGTIEASGDGGGSSNRPPVVSHMYPVTVKVGESVRLRASFSFTDPDGDRLTYTASASNTSVATISISRIGGVATINGVAEGTSTIRITATDPGGLSATGTFVVTVEAAGSGAPDLVVQSPAVDDDTPDAGASFTFSATVRNRGDGQSGSTTLRYYRSSNATISSSDTEVGTDAVGSLRAGGSSPETIALTAPSEEGTYYFGACVDSVDGESSTNNNCSEGVEVEVSGGGGTGRDGECVKGATYGRGESCDVYGTGSSSKLTFTVLSDGRARLGFITAGNGITMTGTINGVKYHFVASHQGGGVWKVDEYIP